MLGETKLIRIHSLLQLSLPAIVLLYCASFQWSYAKWISPVWGYMGLTYRSPDPLLLLIAYVLASLLSIVSPIKLRRASQIIYWILFFTVYIPGLLAPLFVQLDNELMLLLLQLSLTGGMLIIALSYRLKMISFPHYPFTGRLFWMGFIGCYTLSNVILLVIFRSNLHLASLNEVYDVRALGNAVQLQHPSIGYISNLLSNVMNPFLIAYGLIIHRRILAVLGILGQVFIYATAAMKSVLLSPLLIIFIYYAAKKHRDTLVPQFGLLCFGIFAVLTALAGTHKAGIFFAVATIILVRSFAIPGVEIAEYQYFFENFPHTHLGHIHGINMLISNPYRMSLGQEVGYFFAGATDNGRIGNANADFFAMDGIAGFGLPGILIMGVLCAVMFLVLDSCARKCPLPFSAAVLGPCAISLTNNSLFASFLGGGISLIMLMFISMPRHLLDNEAAGCGGPVLMHLSNY